MIEIFLKIYFGANLFFAGYYLANKYRWKRNLNEKIICIIWCILTIFFGIPYIILCFVWAIISVLFGKLDMLFQLRFFAEYFFTNRWENLDKSKLERLNKVSNNKDNLKFRNIVFKFCVRLANRKNNYVYVQSKPDF